MEDVTENLYPTSCGLLSLNNEKKLDPQFLSEALSQRSVHDNLRQLDQSQTKVDFWSNDYLGYSKIDSEKSSLIDSSRIHGSTGSRLISGNSEYVSKLEANLANFHDAESALIFNSGYNANIGIMSCLPQRGDLVLYDELIHASLYDGIRLSNAKRFKFKHNDTDALVDLIKRNFDKFRNIFIVVESVYSMDGDTAPLQELADLRKLYPNIYLIVDEAHALGVFGAQGRGLVNALGLEDSFFARIFTFGKSLGCHGAVVVGSKNLIDFLINFSRSFIYTTALPDNSIMRIQQTYAWLKDELHFKKLRDNISYFKLKSQNKYNFIESTTPIQSLICGSNKITNDVETRLKMAGFNVKGIKSPTVKAGNERIRFCLHSFNTKSEIDSLFDTLAELEK